MFLVVAIVLMASYFFTDAMPVWMWVLLIAASISWLVEEPVMRLVQTRHQQPSPKQQ